jgi:hypothetical protein
VTHGRALVRLLADHEALIELALALDEPPGSLDPLAAWLDADAGHDAGEVGTSLGRLLQPVLACRRRSGALVDGLEARLDRLPAVQKLRTLHEQATEAGADTGYLENLLSHGAGALAAQLARELHPLRQRLRLPAVPVPELSAAERQALPPEARRTAGRLEKQWFELPQRARDLEADLDRVFDGLEAGLRASLVASLRQGLGWKERRPRTLRGQAAPLEGLWQWDLYLGELGLAYCYGVDGLDEELADACFHGRRYQGSASPRFGRLSRGERCDLLGNGATVFLASSALVDALRACGASVQLIAARVAGHGDTEYAVVNALEHHALPRSAGAIARAPALFRVAGCSTEWVVSDRLRRALEAAAPFAGHFREIRLPEN